MRIAAISDVTATCRGNHERQLLTYAPERMGASDRLAHDTITDRHREWMAGLPLTLQVADGVLAFHGSPTDDLVYLLETVDESGARPATESEVLERLGASADVPLLLCGHTHLQRSMQLPTGARRHRSVVRRVPNRRLRLGPGGGDRRGERPPGRRPGTAHRTGVTGTGGDGHPAPSLSITPA